MSTKERDRERDRRVAVIILTCLGAIFLVTTIIATAVYSVRQGYGLGLDDNRIREDWVRPPRGSGTVGDIASLTAMVAADIALIAGWAWLARRLENRPADAGVDEARGWYVVRMPRLEKGLATVAVTCLIGFALLGAFVFPAILIRYGWN